MYKIKTIQEKGKASEKDEKELKEELHWLVEVTKSPDLNFSNKSAKVARK
jgi:hypothetical protein